MISYGARSPLRIYLSILRNAQPPEAVPAVNAVRCSTMKLPGTSRHWKF